jgi:uncharacterized protein (TIGR02145 family)
MYLLLLCIIKSLLTRLIPDSQQIQKQNMKNLKTLIRAGAVLIILFPLGDMSGSSDSSGGSDSSQTTSKSSQTQTKTTQTTTKSTQTTKKPSQTTKKSTQTKPKTTQKSTTTETVSKPKDPGTVTIGTQVWTSVNLNVSTFQNGDSIPEAKTNPEWVAAGESGKPAWCYYNNDPKSGAKYGKLYNWFAVNDSRGLAPVGWKLATDADWVQLVNSVGGQSLAGTRMKTTSGWSEGNNGTNESGFTGLPGGYRVENGTFVNLGSIGTWWSSTESKTFEAIDFYLSLSGSLSRGSTPKQRGESVRCIRK